MAVFVIDTELLKVIKVANTAKQAAYWADILAPTRNYHMNDVAGKSLSVFSEKELRSIYENTDGAPLTLNWGYGELVRRTVELIERLEVDNTPIPELIKLLGHELKPIDPKPQPEKGGRKSSGATSGGAIATRPKAGTATGKVWEIADGLYKAAGNVPERNDVVAACVAEGINPATASTQFGKWKKALGTA
ncbi:hypothetical protein [Vibrio phage VpKK5]|uniref:hypothetical protein n=1 Tax=Vibrio phage VpKK5 TaxID=1538804 RepID=UPI0004F7CFE3|nr:hypothetical protein VC55_gp27 [Vibrio phage VpKK5]AIM40612.1 hypothetical protein [Vibrio phage VpKK5]